MANVEYLICSFCQGPSSRLLRPTLAAHLSNPRCRIRPSDLDWLDKWRLLVPSHVEWDLDKLQDTDFQSLYESELPKVNVVSRVHWVPTIEGHLSESPEFDDLDSWRTIDFPARKRASSQSSPSLNSSSATVGEHTLGPQFPAGQFQDHFEHFVLPDEEVCSKRTLHAYNDDIKATRLPFHSACLRILYEACNEVEFETYATSTVSDVVAEMLLPSWVEGDVSMDYLRKKSELAKDRLITPWGKRWDPLDPTVNYFAVDPSRSIPSSRMRSDLIQHARRATSPDSETMLPPLLRMPGEVLDLISDFIMDMNPLLQQNLDPRQLDLCLYEKSHSFQSLRYTCRQLYHHSFPRAHFLSLLHAETQLERYPISRSFKHHTYLSLPYRFQLSIHITPGQPPYIKPVLPYRRIPSIPPLTALSLSDRAVGGIDWEAMYRGWKQGLGWRNRCEMFARCETWLWEFQERMWKRRVWGRTANYVVTTRAAMQENVVPAPAGGVGGGQEHEDIVMEDIDEGVVDVPVYLAQFQWPS